jgi:IS1 family transposase
MVNMNRLDNTRRVQVVKCLCEGLSIRATVRLTGVAKNTVVKLIADLGTVCDAYHDEHVRNIAAKRIQCDEIWSFCYGKDKNISDEKKAEGAGSLWTWTAIDADSKLIVSYLCGGRDSSWAKAFMADVASRLTKRVQLTTDGHKAYLEAVEGAFGMEVDFAVLQKVYGAPNESEARRYSPAKCIGCETTTVMGNPDPKHISTSYVERQNLTMRMQMRRFTRLTNGFSKKAENHEHMLAIYFMYYNYCRVHKTLRVTPAMEAGIANRVWEVDELIALLQPKTVLDGLIQQSVDSN